MAYYLVQVAYTPEAWAAQVKNPASRVEAVRPALERLGARFFNDAAFLCFGEYDTVFIMEAPDNVTAAALSLTFSAGGALKSIKTTPLLTVDEGIQALRKAGETASTYRPPQ